MSGGVPVARVAVASAIYAIDKPYDYLIPPEMLDTALPGRRVMVPFGRGNRKTEGFIVERAEIPAAEKRKYLSYLFEDGAYLTQQEMRLAVWMCGQYFCTFFEAADAMLPPGIWNRNKEVYAPGPLTLEEAANLAGRSAKKQAILKAVYASERPATEAQIEKLCDCKELGAALRQLVKAGLLTQSQTFDTKIKDKQIHMIQLAIPFDQAKAQIGTGKICEKRLAVIQCVAQAGSIPEKEVCYLTGVQEGLVRRLVRIGVLQSVKTEVYRRPYLRKDMAPPSLELSEHQSAAFQQARSLLDDASHGALLYGVTGSGKTLVYIRLIQEVLAKGKSAILLVPEIALTPQMVHQFCLYFRDEVAVVHSALTPAQRYDEYKRIRSGKAHVVVGTRTAVFAPVEHLGLIIMDEEQEHSYRSMDSAPRYHARDVAKYRAVQEQCLFLMGSATPSVESFYAAQQGKTTLLELPGRYRDTPLPDTLIADMRGQLRQGDASFLSQPLLDALSENLNAGEQSILFINRRGSARMMTCIDCGYIPMCENCSTALTYHSKNNRLMCHHCGYSQEMPSVCPQCGGQNLKLTGVGTQKVESYLQEVFPAARVLRMDADTTTQRISHEKLLDRFAQGKADILLGTQMVAKGLDFANVTLVGVLDGDLSLYCGDYHAQERTFSLLTQVVGRAGRREKPGRAVIQTYTPENPIILAAARQDYLAFYDYEIQSREALGAPPFADLIVFTLSSVNDQEAAGTAQRVAATLVSYFEGEFSDLGSPLMGPVPASISRLNKRYRYTVSFRGKNNKRTRALISRVLSGFYQSQISRLISIAADINPYL